jgi:hypothetical protein
MYAFVAASDAAAAKTAKKSKAAELSALKKRIKDVESVINLLVKDVDVADIAESLADATPLQRRRFRTLEGLQKKLQVMVARICSLCCYAGQTEQQMNALSPAFRYPIEFAYESVT